jgi:hypothetical protein
MSVDTPQIPANPAIFNDTPHESKRICVYPRIRKTFFENQLRQVVSKILLGRTSNKVCDSVVHAGKFSFVYNHLHQRLLKPSQHDSNAYSVSREEGFKRHTVGS